jgi:hypothetical protein
VPSLSYSVSGSYVEVGQPLQVIGLINGGSGDFNYQWYVNGGAILGANAGLVLYYGTASGTYNFGLQIVDIGLNSPATVNANGTANVVSVTYYNPIAINIAPVYSVVNNPQVTSVNTVSTITATVSGGSGTFSYQWYVDNERVSIFIKQRRLSYGLCCGDG